MSFGGCNICSSCTMSKAKSNFIEQNALSCLGRALIDLQSCPALPPHLHCLFCSKKAAVAPDNLDNALTYQKRVRMLAVLVQASLLHKFEI